MILWRLTQDALGIYAGSCISEGQYKALYYLDRCLFEPLTEEDQGELIQSNEPQYCLEKGIECLYFYNENELNIFLSKLNGI